MEDVWYFADSNGSIGPITLEDLQNRLKSIPLEKDVLVWSPKFSEWKKRADVVELKTPAAAPLPMPPPLPPSFPSGASGSPEKETSGTIFKNPFNGIVVTLFVAYFVVNHITPDAKNAINLVAENWVFWLFMMIAGIIVVRAKSNWKFLFAALFAVLPLLALPGLYHTDEQRGLIHAGFALTGFILGAFVGLALKRSSLR